MNPAQSLIRYSAIVTFVFAATCFGESPDVAAALADRAKFQPEEQQHLYYITKRGYAGDDPTAPVHARLDLDRAIKLVVASNTRQQVIERCVPVSVNDDLLRINIKDLGWHPDDWAEVSGFRNPYTLEGSPLIVRADWLLVELTDGRQSDSHLRLLFGGSNIPKTSDDVRKFFGVDNTVANHFGMIEGKSAVNIHGVRWIENRSVPRGSYYFTQDSKFLDFDHDPVEHPGRGFKVDGEEHILSHRKISTILGREGALPFYWLANAEGKLVNEAPADLVVNTIPFRGAPLIVTPGACIQCHKEGYNPVKRNEVRELTKSGVPLYEKLNKSGELERFHGIDLTPVIDADNLKHAMGVVLACGCTPDSAAKSFKEAIDKYDAPLNLEDVARESDCSVEQAAKVLIGNIPTRLLSLNKGNELQPDNTRSERGAVPRAAYEQYALSIYNKIHGSGGDIVAISKERPKAAEPPKVAPEKQAPKPAPRTQNSSSRNRR